MQKEFGVKTDSQEIIHALQTKSFPEFLHDAFLGSCIDDELTLEPKPTFEKYPKDNETASNEEFIKKIKEVIATDTPMTLDGICLYYEKDGKCKEKHSVVISGYRYVCKDKSEKKEDCKHVFKIHNSWGDDWQTANADGWLDAEVLLGNTIDGTIAWLKK
ncbi:MAG: hypothetical protein ACXW00_08675 [Methylobacter sp.]